MFKYNQNPFTKPNGLSFLNQETFIVQQHYREVHYETLY